MDKANWAMVCGQARRRRARLVNALLAKEPTDPDVAKLAYRVYRNREEAEKANAIAANALKAHPEDKQLQYMVAVAARAQPRGRTPGRASSSPSRRMIHSGRRCFWPTRIAS